MNKVTAIWGYLSVLVSTVSCKNVGGLGMMPHAMDVDKPEKNIRIDNPVANQLLQEGAIQGNLEKVNLAIEQGADVNCKIARTAPGTDGPPSLTDEEIYSLTPLGLAVFYAGEKAAEGDSPVDEGDRPAIVRALLEAGAAPNPRTKCHERTPLFIAVGKNLREITKALLEHPEVDVNAVESDRDGYGEEGNSADRRGRSPLFRAIENQNEAIVSELLKHKDINVNQKQEPYSNYPINLAMKQGNVAIVKALLEHPKIDLTTEAGCDPGGTPLDFWTLHAELPDIETDYQEINRILISKCAAVLYDQLAAGMTVEEALHKIYYWFRPEDPLHVYLAYDYLDALTSIFEKLPTIHERKLKNSQSAARKLLEGAVAECQKKRETAGRNSDVRLLPSTELEIVNELAFNGIDMLYRIRNELRNNIIKRFKIMRSKNKLGDDAYLETLQAIAERTSYTERAKQKLGNAIKALKQLPIVNQ
jgi:hypothetical protein